MRPTHIERSLHVWKVTYTSEKRPVKETCRYDKHSRLILHCAKFYYLLLLHLSKETCKREFHTSKETYKRDQTLKSPIYYFASRETILVYTSLEFFSKRQVSFTGLYSLAYVTFCKCRLLFNIRRSHFTYICLDSHIYVSFGNTLDDCDNRFAAREI